MIATEVMILGTLHSFHDKNPNYSYEDIFAIIDKFEPDVIGVEIREEDIKQSKEYLGNYYPYEMIEAKFRYDNTYTVLGFDWLGKDIEKKLIPPEYFSNLEVKKLENELNKSQNHTKEKALSDVIDAQRLPIFEEATAEECNSEKYDLLCHILYSQKDIMFENTPYEAINTFFRDRQAQIDKNMINIIKENAGKRIIFLTGLDHKLFATRAVKEYFNKDAGNKQDRVVELKDLE